MDRWRGKVAVVTGASSGIGASIASSLVEEGVKVVGFARRVERVEELAKKLAKHPGKLIAVKCDVSKKDEVIKAFKWVKENVGPVQILVNNAGLYKQGSLLDECHDDWKIILETNVLGLTLCSQQAIEQMRDNNLQGHIIHINSVAGHTPMVGGGPFKPLFNIYSPSKYAVTCLSDAMRQELLYVKAKIKVTSISPGLVKTEIFETAGSTMDLSQADQLQTKDISDAAIYVLGTGPNVQVKELTIAPLDEIR